MISFYRRAQGTGRSVSTVISLCFPADDLSQDTSLRALYEQQGQPETGLHAAARMAWGVMVALVDAETPDRQRKCEMHQAAAVVGILYK